MFYGFDLAVAQHFHFGFVEEFVSTFDEFAADDLIVQVLEDAVNAGDARPVFRRFIGQRVGVVGLADVEQVKRGPVPGEAHFLDHRAHVVVPLHEAISIEAVVEDGARIEHGQRNHGVGAVVETLLQEGREVEFGDEGPEADAFDAEALGVFEKIVLVVVGGEDPFGVGVRHQTGE